jgi:hypothetical protein
MPDTTRCGPGQSTIDEQVERLTSIFVDLRRVLGVGFKHAHQNGFGNESGAKPLSQDIGMKRRVAWR